MPNPRGDGPTLASEQPTVPREKAIPSTPIPDLAVEQRLADEGNALVIGFDEVGRGALAGPVMVGAVALRANRVPDLVVPPGLRDSKLLTEHRREALFDPLQQWAAAYAVGQSSNEEIDEWGISYALGVAALRALRDVECRLGYGQSGQRPVAGEGTDRTTGAVLRPELPIGAILDGPHDYISTALGTFDAPDVPVPPTVRTLVKADQRCATVAAASVIAKVTRDRLMVAIARGNSAYRPYAWERNKGYGSAAHRAAIARLGPTALHRKSWHLGV